MTGIDTKLTRFHVYSTAIIFTILNIIKVIEVQTTTVGLKNKKTKKDGALVPNWGAEKKCVDPCTVCCITS